MIFRFFRKKLPKSQGDAFWNFSNFLQLDPSPPWLSACGAHFDGLSTSTGLSPQKFLKNSKKLLHFPSSKILDPRMGTRWSKTRNIQIQARLIFAGGDSESRDTSSPKIGTKLRSIRVFITNSNRFRETYGYFWLNLRFFITIGFLNFIGGNTGE